MDVVSTILIFIPFLVILWLANLSYRKRIEGDLRNERTLKLLAYGLLFLLYALLMLFGMGLLGVGLVGVLAPQVFDAPSLTASGFPADRLPWMGGSLLVFSLLGLILLTRPARRLFARFTPIDPSHPVHAVALSFSAMVLINLAFTVAIGLENLANMLQSTAQAGVQSSPAPGLWGQNLMFVVLGLIGVGVLARRGFPAALIRLGIIRPTIRQAVIGVLAGLVLVPIVIGAEALATKLGLGSSAGVERLTEQLVGPLTQSAFGILTLGLAAALGEETVFRGASAAALRPRLYVSPVRAAPQPVRAELFDACGFPRWAGAGDHSLASEYDDVHDDTRRLQHVLGADHVTGDYAEYLTPPSAERVADLRRCATAWRTKPRRSFAILEQHRRQLVAVLPHDRVLFSQHCEKGQHDLPRFAVAEALVVAQDVEEGIHAAPQVAGRDF